jgi:exocyst complex component 5
MHIPFRDLKSYQDTISGFGIASLHERFEFIRQLGNVFLVRPEILRSYITENYLGRIDSTLLKPYLAQRSDWGQFEKGFNDGDEIGTEGGGGGGLRERFGVGRLSVMMKELEGLKLGEGITMGMPTFPTIPSGFASGFSMSHFGS